jgi:hypothetical protein
MTGFASKRKAAQSKEMTDWFPVTTFPVHKGAYEVADDSMKKICFSKWDGYKWCLVMPSVTSAMAQRDRSWTMYTASGIKWRGFTTKQEKRS